MVDIATPVVGRDEDDLLPGPAINPKDQVVRGRGARLSGPAISIFLGLYVLWTLAPFYIMVTSAFKQRGSAFNLPAEGDWGGAAKKLFVFEPTGEHFAALFRAGDFERYMTNSVLAALGSAVISIVFGTTAAYAISRGRFRGKSDLYFWIISTRMAPVVAVTVPLYAIFKNLGLLGSIPGLILAYTVFNLPFSIWILKGFFDSVPYEIEEAYMVDGHSRWQALLKIVPLVVPGLAAVLVLCILLAWNDFIFAAVMGGESAKTLPVATQGLKSASGIEWGQIMAAGIVTVAPMLLLGIVIRKYMVQGLTMGAVKQ
ncbi:carbohydrate ABC transporter permease [Oryzobacter sp. R7]|uniref:carbohydrate ABC transporter permease n=1 Tax=Oryzobacter faecalis TaxID=3388656 RepID=UPI00398CB8DC